MKTIQYNIKKTLSVSNKDNSTDDKKDKMREVIKNIKTNDLSCNVNNILNDHVAQCYYCNLNIFFIFEKIRENKQWTLDRLNNYDEHTNQNTIISCLKCNLQRRRKNSEKFKFTKSNFG